MTTFTLPTPLSTNDLYANVNNRTVKTREARAWVKLAHQWLQAQRVKHVQSPVSVHLIVAYNGSRDHDNFFKITLDAIKTFGVITNDNMKHVAALSIGYSKDRKEKDGIQITVEPFQINT